MGDIPDDVNVSDCIADVDMSIIAAAAAAAEDNPSNSTSEGEKKNVVMGNYV